MYIRLKSWEVPWDEDNLSSNNSNRRLHCKIIIACWCEMGPSIISNSHS